ncbi:glycoside hydrolase family 43 protein [Hymenobacter cellulosilyticus]|uniref:Glycoside hydrolase family 43 protein n=1 Tax=Hymenobacter cellulosilyticus TaxID=2932248 RepID=A0A8T9Q3D4_9BACT|nr:glycoside hydrolase family 43 protein [Hymenobacter cellulosilyticus]UOQ71977.1 glycoside hydrolase family 43 protein [Hymenobacter cellulosilyticus]
MFSFSRLIPLSLLALTLACQKAATPAPPPVTPTTTTTFTNPLLTVGPDPWVIRRGDVYYYMHTTGNNLTIRKTAKMSELGSAVSTVVWTPQQTGVNQRDIWAPELHFLDGKWYIYYSADPLCCDGHRINVLENASADPTTGTWVDKGRIAVPGQDLWAIDGTVLEQNGKRYLLWSGHEVASSQVQRLYIAEMSNPWTLVGPRVELSRPEYSWEQNGTPAVNEGPQVLKHGDKTFIIYSASHCSTDDYALGMLTASATADPMKLTAWTKSATPVFVKNPAGRAFGPGHNSFFQSKDGTEDWILYHANPQPGQGCGDNRSPRMQKFTWNADGTPAFGTPVATATALPKPAGE